jgi:nitrate/nitrite-specific signal transduction histidine kinase
MAVEAISNAVRHAAPASVRVDLATSRRRAIVTIRDDGSGFDAAATLSEGDARGRGEGLGLLGMSRQASWLGGRASVRSSPGTGTVIRISIPFERYRLAGETSAQAGPEVAATSGTTVAPAGRIMRAPTQRQPASHPEV